MKYYLPSSSPVCWYKKSICQFLAKDCAHIGFKPLKRQAKFVADYIYFYFFNFSKKTSLDISCELSEKQTIWQTIHMKYQDLFSLKN